MPHPYLPTQRVLLQRQGLVFCEAGAEPPGDKRENVMRAVDVNLAGLGYALTSRLRDRLAGLPIAALTEAQAWLWATLAEPLGGTFTHKPFYRNFPFVPRDTHALWVQRMLVHYLQAPDQPCLFCRRVGTTHVLRPCQHVVCDHCFDGANVSGCPVCGRHADPASPFFQPDDPAMHAVPAERVRFKLIDLGDDLETAAAGYLQALCARKQAMSAQDREDLIALVADQGDRALAWLPDVIPVRETTATVLAELHRAGVAVPAETMAARLSTATDVLRFLAAYSGEDASLQGRTVRTLTPQGDVATRTVKRFRVARLPRALRKQVLALLDRLGEETLIEDMLRHRSLWVWLGEFLHPHEYATRFPNTARAFAVVRKKAPDGTAAPAFRGRASRLEAALLRRDVDALIPMLAERPGELARRLDHLLRLVAADPDATRKLIATFGDRLGACATPVLLTLYALLPTRVAPAPVRIYWPKGAVARGVSAADTRPPLTPEAIQATMRAIEAELLARFAAKPAVDDALVDTALKTVVVPFNERTAARAAIALPRGSRVALEEGKTVRLFLHWCQPSGPDNRTDLDLSVAFYDADWQYQGVCSYYQLDYPLEGPVIARSSGDFTDAPFPDGASEFVDIDRELARATGLRYAVMVVNAFAGLPFSALERAFAGLMLRDDVHGAAFDPRTVTLKFALEGQNGVFVPLVLDLDDATVHWLDLYAKGEWAFNNVETSKKDLSRVCPEMIAYFGSGLRPAMYDLALLHAAARAERVYLRAEADTTCFERRGDDAPTFLARLRLAVDGGPAAAPPGADGRSVLAALHTGDVALPESSARYCLFPDRVSGNMAASDLLS